MKCCTLPTGEGKVKKSKTHKGSGTNSPLAKSAHACKGKKGKKFKECVKAKIKKM